MRGEKIVFDFKDDITIIISIYIMCVEVGEEK